MLKLKKKLFLSGIAALAAFTFMGCPDPSKGPDQPERPSWLPDVVEWPFETEDTVDVISENLFDNGDFDGTNVDDGLIYKTESGCNVTTDVEGGASGNCIRVAQTGSAEKQWEEFQIDLTDLYGQGKSYYLSFKLKADPEAATTVWTTTTEGEGEEAVAVPVNYKSNNQTLNVSYSVYSGAVKNWANEQKAAGNTDVEDYYDFDDELPGTEGIVSPWEGEFSKDLVFEEALPGVKLTTTLPVATDEWTQYDFVIPSSQIEEKINNTGLYSFSISLYMGGHAEGGYSYLLDDIVIKDLNTEIYRIGKAWQDPEDSAEE